MADTHAATVFAADFYRAALNASLFAGKDDTLPAICAVRFYSREDGTVTAEATNRYVASQETLTLVNPETGEAQGPCILTGADGEEENNCTTHEHEILSTDLDVVVEVKGLTKITKMLKQLQESKGYGMAPLVRIEWAEDENHVAFTLTHDYAPDQTLRAERVQSEFPRGIGGFFDNHRKLGDGAELPDGFQTWRIALEWLAVLAKVETADGKRSFNPAEFSFGLPGKPVLVNIGEAFRALVMPIRNGT